MHRTPTAIHLLLAVVAVVLGAVPGHAQGGDKALKTQADALFEKGAYAEAWPMYSQLVSLSPQDHELNYKYGTCTIYSGEEKSKAIGYLRYSVGGPSTPGLAWYFLGKAYQLDYRFDEALDAYNQFKGTADKKLLARYPVEANERQCRNGKYLLSNLKDIEVLNKVEVDATDYFRFYDLSDIGGKIVVTPEELLTSFDRKSGERFLTYLPSGGGPLYFSSYGKDGKTGRDLYRTELMPNGSYAQPEKLAGYINTDQDEDFGVMGPDGKTFYFSSRGHNSMGGYDVFRTAYDSNMDVFGMPENMDFAVNTPADEMLYIVGPDGAQACFASDRDSRQGQVNVYRVGTTQTPLNLTVLKGVYASEFGPVTKAARIIVEDELTRERVADVMTDDHGNYILVLPEGGRYKFVVEDGRMSRTFWSTVEAPPSYQVGAYAQEITLTQQGGGQLDIKSHFDEPLGDDVMALAMDEIRRRARLDVNAGAEMAQDNAAAPRGDDPLQQAGFDGTVSLASALEMAQEDARGRAALAGEQERQSHAALDLALRNAGEAETYAEQAASLVARSADAATPAEKDRLLRSAGEAKQRSMEATARAHAAYRTGQAMVQASARTREEARRTEALSARIATERSSANKQELTNALIELKGNLDQRKGPKAEPDEAEKMRRTASRLSDDATHQMRQAASQREEEVFLANRVERTAKDAAEAKGKRKQELEAQLATLKEQHAALAQEVDKLFAKVGSSEQEAAMARGQSGLVNYLASDPQLGTDRQVQPDEVMGMEDRLARIRASNDALEIGDGYMPMAMQSAEERERRTFDWGAAEVLAVRPGTVTTRAAEMHINTTASGSTQSTTVAQGTSNDTASMTGSGAGPGTSASVTMETRGTDLVNGPVVPSPLEADKVAAGPNGRAVADQPAAEQDHKGPGEQEDDEERAFLLANRLAELEQLRSVERHRARRDSLDGAIAAQKERIKAFQAGELDEDWPEEPKRRVPMLTYLSFDMAILDEELVEEIYPGFNLAWQAIQDGPGSGQEKAVRLHALEMQLVDSVDAQTARATSYLEAHPEASNEVLARLERWRRLKDEHVDRANKALADTGQEYAATETRALENTQIQAPAEAMPSIPKGVSPTPHNDSYIQIPEDTEHIYASEIAPRSKDGVEAVARKDRDLGIATSMQDEIDSLKRELADVVAAKEYNKLEEKIDRKYDDLLIHRVEMAQRTAFISRTEFKVAKDSAKVLVKGLAQQRVAGNEPLVELARSFESSADEGMDRAKTMRKEADNVRDIFRRNSLYKQAYSEELNALRDMDKAHTVRNYLLSGKAIPGESLTYEEVEWRMFPDLLARAVEAATEENEVAVTGLPEALPAEQAEGTPNARTAPDRDQAALVGYLDRYYYLDAQERQLVLEGEDESRYFLMKGRALADRSEAAAAASEADGARQLADVLTGEASAQRREQADGGQIDEVQLARLDARSSDLLHRADSLQAVADRLLSSADRVDAQAAGWMEALPADRSSVIMDLEQTKRRTDPVLARTRPQPVVAEAVDRSVELDESAPVTTVAVVETTEQDVAMERETPVQDAAVVAPSPVIADPVADLPVRHVEPANVTSNREERAEAPERSTVLPATPGPAADMPRQPLTEDQFSFRDQPIARQEAIPIDAPLPSGVVYKVQVGAFRNELPLEAFNDMSPVTGEAAGNGLTRYTAGMFTTAESARAAGSLVRARGYRDAFVVAYIDGRRVPLREAMQAERAPLAVITPTPVTAGTGTGRIVSPAGDAAATRTTQEPAATQPVVLSDPTVQASAEEAVLAQYPSSAEELLASFRPATTSTDYYNDPTAAPAVQVELVKGLFFTVQVGVYSKPTPLDRLFNITPLNSELTANGKIRYTTGRFQQEAVAGQRRQGAITLGVTDAFVTAYLNGKRIPLLDARALLAKFGPSILAGPDTSEQ